MATSEPRPRTTRTGKPLNGFGLWLDDELRARDLIPAELARRIGAPRQVVSAWLWDRRPSPEYCRRIADTLAVPFPLVLERAGHTRPVDRASDPRERAKVLIDLLPGEALPVVLAMLEGLRRDRAVVAAALHEQLGGAAEPAAERHGAPERQDPDREDR